MYFASATYFFVVPLASDKFPPNLGEEEGLTERTRRRIILVETHFEQILLALGADAHFAATDEGLTLSMYALCISKHGKTTALVLWKFAGSIWPGTACARAEEGRLVT